MGILKTGVRLASIIIALAGFTVSEIFAAELTNPGFEASIEDPDADPLSGWTSTVSDSVTVVGTEGPEYPTYVDYGIIVEPASGELMARLGSPKKINEKQLLGPNSIEQTFTPKNKTLIFAFRLFSWEHRGNDRFSISVDGPDGIKLTAIDGSPLAIPVAAEPDIYHTCLEGPSCTAIIGDGKRDVLLDSEWIQFAVRGLPTEGEEVTIKFSVESTSNKAHPTWAYLDHLSPELTLDKTADVTGYNAVGNVINYTYSATNSGDISLAGPVSVADDKTTNENCPEISSTGNGNDDLDPGESLACTASYTITQTDLDAGSVTNMAIANAGGTDSNQDTVTVNAIQTPAITIEKSTDDTDYDEVGDVITYTYVATNTGNVTLSNVSISDPLPNLSALSCTLQPAALAPLAKLTCTATYSITQADLDNGSVASTATVDGTEPDGNPVTYSASAISNSVTTHAVQTPAIGIEKTADTKIYKQANDVITYTLTIENTGNVTLTSVTVTDPLTGLSAIDCGIAVGNDITIETLAPLDSVACSTTYTITTGDIPGSVNNTATATATAPDGVTEVEDSGSVTVTWENSPPVAKFSFGDIMEGDLVAFPDESSDPDSVYGDTLSWEWKISGSTEVITEQNPIIIFPDNGNEITLTVTDSYGLSDSISSLEIADPTNPGEYGLGIDNMPPLVTVLNQEIVAGQSLELFGRFIDPGYMDSHSVDWQVDSATPTNSTKNQTFGIPFTTTGSTTADVLQTPAANADPYSGKLTVTDKDGAAGTATFEMNVLSTLDQREPNNDLFTAPPMNSGWVYRSNIDSIGDIDIFEVKLPDGESLPAGSEILVKLKELPADFDLVVLSYLPEDASATAWLKNAWLKNAWLKNAWLKNAWLGTAWLKNAWLKNAWLKNAWLKNPYEGTAWLKNAWLKNAWLKNAWLKNPYIDTAWLKNAWLKNAWLKNGYSGYFAQQIPLSELAQEEFVGEQLGGADLTISELPLDLLTLEGVSVAGFSANRGLDDDVVLARTDYPGTKIYVAIVPNNGAFSSTPYALQIETSIPLDIVDMLGSNCVGSPLVTNHVPSTLSSSGSATPSTLFVSQKERFDATHGVGSWSSVESSLLQMSNMATPEHYAILNIDNSVYDNWDINPCSVEAANNVATIIRNEIFTTLSTTPSIEHVVIIGSDNIIPHRRVPDETAVSNEKLYMDSQLIPGTPLFISTYLGYNLTDDYYADNQPLIIQGRELYVPKLSNARLVESPDEINPVISAFVTSGGLLDLSSSLVTGYDFFRDGAKLTAQSLDKVLATPSTTLPDDLLSETPDLTDDSWDLTALKCALLGEGCLSGDVPGPHDLNIVNTHYNHYSAITAFGYHSGEYDDVLTSLDILDSNGKLSNGVYATIGCHSGLSVPDGWAFDGTDAGSNDPNLDFPQAMSSQNILHIGSTGYGLGTDDGIGGTERLIAIFADELTKGGTVGQALVRAKQNYINNLSAITVYDEKSSIQTTMYGLPMYRLAGAIAPTVQYANVAIDGFEEDYTGTYTENKLEGRGSYFTVVDGEHQATAWRPIQPKKTTDVTSTDPSFPVHDVLITGGSYEDIADFDPVITRPKNWWESEDTDEPLVCLDAYWPASIASINSLPVLDALKQTLVVIPGQFRCTGVDTSTGKERVIGIQRKLTSLQYETTGSSVADDPDFSPPVIKEVDLITTDTGVEVTVDTIDDSAVKQIVLLIFDGGVINSYSLTTNGPGPYTLNIPIPSEDAQMLLQVVDDAGNVARWSAKGAKIRSVMVQAGTASTDLSLPATLTGTIFDFEGLLEDLPTVFYRWEFGDGAYDFGTLAIDGVATSIVSVDPLTGNATFNVEHQYNGLYDYTTATLKVTDSLGGIGVDSVVAGFCGDTVDDNLSGPLAFLDYVGCGTTHDDIQVSISLEVNAAELGDNQFRVHLDLDSDGKSDEMLKYSASNQSATGLSSLQVTEEGNVVIFTFNIAELGLTYGDSFDWYAETQDGVAGGAGQGFVDRMPDDGYFTYLVY